MEWNFVNRGIDQDWIKLETGPKATCEFIQVKSFITARQLRSYQCTEATFVLFRHSRRDEKAMLS